jgi:hypothetical protein
MVQKLVSVSFLIILGVVCVSAELDFVPYLFGANPGAPPAGWNDAKQAIIASKIGINTYRVWLPESYLDQWGYDIAFKTGAMGTYKDVGFKNLVGNLNTPTFAHSNAPDSGSTYAYSPKNLNQAIWLNDGNVNPDNYWAVYVNKTVTMYKDYIKIWEVWNEPDFVSNWQATQTWDTENPQPSDLVNWHDTIENYNRLMRITWEVARKVDPTAHVAVGGLGYPNFLDAMLRNTDGQGGENGGNYFDTLSFHFYPVFASKNSSDDWANNFEAQVKDMLEICTARSYDPNYIICTESGAPTKSTSSAPGSTALQQNYFTKMSVLAQVNGVSQVHWWSLTDAKDSGSDNPFRYMGLYADITQSTPENAEPKASTTAMKTYTDVLHGYDYYEVSVDILTDLDARARGFAFTNGSNIAVVMWANNAGQHDESFVLDLSLSTTKIWTRIQFDGSKNTLAPASGKIDVQISPIPIFLFSSETVNVPIGFAPQTPLGSGNNGPSVNNPNSPNLNSMAHKQLSTVLFGSVLACLAALI